MRNSPMTAPSSTTLLPCIYCNTPTPRGNKGEHIVPKSMGGGRTLNHLKPANRRVCQKCNSGPLADIDNELISRSFLSVVASQEISASLWQAWDVDHAANNLLVEARPHWDEDELLSQLVCYPQMTFERNGHHIRGDGEEIQRFSFEDFRKVMVRAVRRCFEKFNAGQKRAIHFERLETDVSLHGYRLAPRIFTRHTIDEIAANINDQSFILRYNNEDDRRLALRTLAALDENVKYRSTTQQLGSRLPAIAFTFDIAKIVRALVKIGINLVAAYCPNTPVNRSTFRRAVRMVRGETFPLPTYLAANGFIHIEAIDEIKQPGAHTFRMMYMQPYWRIYSSFFGGRIGTSVFFLGRSHESWNQLDIVAPIDSKDWIATESGILNPIRVKIDWSDNKKIMPSVKIQRTVSRIEAELVTAKAR